MKNLTFQRGFSLLNQDIMDLVEQVRPQYDKGEAIEHHQQQIKAKQESLRKAKNQNQVEYYPGPIGVLSMGLPKVLQDGKNKSKYNQKGVNSGLSFT